MLALLAVFLLLFMAGCGSSSAATSGSSAAKGVSGAAVQPLTVKMLDVGQGDCLLIRTAEQTILIDTGDLDEHEKLRAALKKEKVTTVDKLIITHPHADHLGGASVVLKECQVRAVYDNGQPATAKFYRDYLKEVKRQGIAYKTLRDGDTLDFGGGVSFQVLSPTQDMVAAGEAAKDKKDKPNLNDNSVVGRLVYGSFSMLFTGDCEAEYEKEILRRHGGELRSTLLKAPHHGSKNASSLAYLKAVQPEAVLISLGAGNEYGHPHKAAMDRYAKQKIQVYRTDLQGTLTVTSDGKGYEIKGEK